MCIAIVLCVKTKRARKMQISQGHIHVSIWHTIYYACAVQCFSWTVSLTLVLTKPDISFKYRLEKVGSDAKKGCCKAVDAFGLIPDHKADNHYDDNIVSKH